MNRSTRFTPNKLMVDKKRHIWVQEYPPFSEGRGCGIAMVNDGVHGTRCGSWTYRKGRSYLDVKLRETLPV